MGCRRRSTRRRWRRRYSTRLVEPAPKRHFTVGIIDDVSKLSLKHDASFDTEAEGVTRAVFYGLGADGTVGATKNTVKIIGESTPLHAQGYFVYDSKKSGAITVSHLRFGPKPIESTYLIGKADFIACHQFEFMEKLDVLALARPGATFLLNSPYGPDEVWSKLPREAQQSILDRKLRFFVVDALAVAKQAGLAGRINTVTQACFFAISGILPRDEAIDKIKDSIRKTYGKRGETVLARNFAAVDGSLAAMAEVKVPERADSLMSRRPIVPRAAPDFVQRVTAMMMDGKGDLLPVSALPVDGTFPTGTTQWEKRSIALEIPIWDETICTQCAICPLVCPHAAIRMTVFSPEEMARAPSTFKAVPWARKDGGPLDGMMYSLQVAPEDCTGCGVCVDVCPSRSKQVVKHKAINMEPKLDHLEAERANYDFFLSLPEVRPSFDKIDGLRGSQLRQPLFEYSGACSGCGETPYLKLLSQLYGDHLVIANATGCSSIYGGNLPSTPYSQNAQGQGPAWANSLFEDNAEFGLGMRLAYDAQQDLARLLVVQMRDVIGGELADALVGAPQDNDEQIAEQRGRVKQLKQILARLSVPEANRLLAVADSLVVRSVWIVGGDGWAYDIGYGGVDHVLASGRNVNILVLDTEVYSNTGGQASKSTQRGAVAKFAAAGKSIGKKDLGMIAMAYGNVYVAQVAMGANPVHTVRTFQEAASWNGPSLIIAYSHCIAHGIDMTTGMSHQRDAVKSGYLTLYHYDPRLGMGGADHPLKLDSRKPTIPLEQFTMKEGRYAMLAQADPARAKALSRQAQAEADARWQFYEQVAGVHRVVAEAISTDDGAKEGGAVAAAPTTMHRDQPQRRRPNDDCRPHHTLSWPRAEASRRRLGLPADRFDREPQAARGCRRRRRRPALAVRGTDRARGNGHAQPDALRLGAVARGTRILSRAAAVQHRPGPVPRLIADAKKALAVPVIASLNGYTPGGWTSIARQCEQAGADAIELNVYFLATTLSDTSASVEARYIDLVKSVAGQVKIPVAVKVAPYFSAMANMAGRLTEAGAGGLVLFNRFLQPDIELEELQVAPHLVLSTSDELRLALRWIAILRGRVGASLAATGGVHTTEDVLKSLFAGADCVMIASCLLRKGPAHIRTLVRGVEAWLAERDYESVEQMKGALSQQSCPDPDAFERANYMKALKSYTSEFA
jgi:pyruvate/2-oxoacid:ferredoxin oxidoreductase beta subunit/Pyruvate/2-oxoacid:ferredoxin oxidoreductase gamma subunit/dihydroorotate dehydrogenase/Pyruvate/2-oxoacid:ferredoxin oxidoreductase delta subunit